MLVIADQFVHVVHALATVGAPLPAHGRRDASDGSTILNNGFAFVLEAVQPCPRVNASLGSAFG